MGKSGATSSHRPSQRAPHHGSLAAEVNRGEAVPVASPTPRQNQALLNTRTGRSLQSEIAKRIFMYWRTLLGIELVEGMPRRGHAEFLIGGALAMWAWRARQSPPIPVQQLSTPDFLGTVQNILRSL